MNTMERDSPLLKAAGDSTSESGSEKNNETTGSEPQAEVRGGHCCLDPRSFGYKFQILALICLLPLGSSFVYSQPASLQRTIKNVMQVNTAQYTLLYSLYSWPNVILSIFGGYLLDRVFGIRWGAVIFSTLVCIGHLIFALGAFFNSFITMGAGRFIFGIGGEILAVAQSAYLVSWFNGQRLGLFCGFLHSVSVTAKSLSLTFTQRLYDKKFSYISTNHVRLGAVLMFGIAFCIFSLGAAAILGLLDKKAEKVLHRKESRTREKFDLKHIKNFPLQLWMLFIICTAYYVSVFPFIALAQVFFVNKFGTSLTHANIFASLIYIASSVVARIMGMIMQGTGFNLVWLNVGTILTLGAHAMIAFVGNAHANPILPLIVMGVAYGIQSSVLWPLVALIVRKHQLRTAYGIMQSIENVGLAVVTVVAGIIVDMEGYLILEVFFIAILCVALTAGIILYFLNIRSGGKLNTKIVKAKEIAKDPAEAKEQIPDYILPLTIPECPRAALLK